MPHHIQVPKFAFSSMAAVAALLLVTSCGSDSADETASAASSSDATTDAAETGGASDQVAAAQTIVEEIAKPPTTITVTEPLTGPPEAGKTMVFLKCDTGSCGPLSEGVQEAAEAAGWNYEEIAYKSADPATLAAGMTQALNFDPVAVAMSGIPPEAGWASVLPDYAAAGVPIITSYLSGVEFDDTIIADIGGPADYENTGKIMANWFIADSDGKGTAVLQRVDDFPILKVWSDAFADAVKAGCSDCKVVDLKNTIPDVFAGKVVASSVSTLRSTPDAGYLISSNAEFVDGLDAALGAAGLSGKVVLAGSNPSVGQLQLLKDGTGSAQAFPGLALKYSGWSIVDVAIRQSLGMSFETDNGGLPTQLLLPKGDFAVDQSYDQPADFRDQFKKLWQVG